MTTTTKPSLRQITERAIGELLRASTLDKTHGAYTEDELLALLKFSFEMRLLLNPEGVHAVVELAAYGALRYLEDMRAAKAGERMVTA